MWEVARAEIGSAVTWTIWRLGLAPRCEDFVDRLVVGEDSPFGDAIAEDYGLPGGGHAATEMRRHRIFAPSQKI